MDADGSSGATKVLVKEMDTRSLDDVPPNYIFADR